MDVRAGVAFELPKMAVSRPMILNGGGFLKILDTYSVGSYAAKAVSLRGSLGTKQPDYCLKCPNFRSQATNRLHARLKGGLQFGVQGARSMLKIIGDPKCLSPRKSLL